MEPLGPGEAAPPRPQGAPFRVSSCTTCRQEMPAVAGSASVTPATVTPWYQSTLAFDRHRGFRWFSWVSGVALLWRRDRRLTLMLVAAFVARRQYVENLRESIHQHRVDFGLLRHEGVPGLPLVPLGLASIRCRVSASEVPWTPRRYRATSSRARTACASRRK